MSGWKRMATEGYVPARTADGKRALASVDEIASIIALHADVTEIHMKGGNQFLVDVSFNDLLQGMGVYLVEGTVKDDANGSDLDAFELQVEALAGDYVDRGMSPPEAYRRAKREAGRLMAARQRGGSDA